MSKEAPWNILTFIAHFLFILAAWTLVIKFLFPISFALAEDLPLASYIFWDFWWVIHIALALSILNWSRRTYYFALLVSVVEIAIIVAKFVFFAAAPVWSIWKTNWFINKIFVLTCFVFLFIILIRYRGMLQGDSYEQA